MFDVCSVHLGCILSSYGFLLYRFPGLRTENDIMDFSVYIEWRISRGSHRCRAAEFRSMPFLLAIYGKKDVIHCKYSINQSTK